MKWGIDLSKKGFTLIESMLGLFLLGLIAVNILPIANLSFIRFKNQKTKMEMIYIGEMAMEKIKAFNMDGNSDLFIYDASVSEIIEAFKENNSIEILVPKERKKCEKYFLKICKTQKSASLWKVSIFVFNNVKEGNITYVEYIAYIPQK